MSERAWLVEWRFNGVQWLYLWPSAPGGFSFTADPNSALRFARRQDAEACLAWAREVDRRRGAGIAGGELLVTEHEWNAAASPQAPAAQPVHCPACGYELTHAPQAAETLTDAARAVLAERARQMSVEGWTPEHDDEHDAGELSAAGSAYATAAADMLHPMSQGDGAFQAVPPAIWPWSQEWWKHSEPRRMLIKAAALLLAEIERIDREEKRHG